MLLSKVFSASSTCPVLCRDFITVQKLDISPLEKLSSNSSRQSSRLPPDSKSFRSLRSAVFSLLFSTTITASLRASAMYCPPRFPYSTDLLISMMSGIISSLDALFLSRNIKSKNSHPMIPATSEIGFVASLLKIPALIKNAIIANMPAIKPLNKYHWLTESWSFNKTPAPIFLSWICFSYTNLVNPFEFLILSKCFFASLVGVVPEIR